ncbi:MAG: CHAP domain-containing protein [Bacilli bacterium]|nr:CHAP domain-containing protein [Bacilli bacterium]
MYILLDACQHPGILRIIYFGSLLLDIVFTLVPIGLIVILMIDFSKAVIGGDEKAVKSTKIVGKRIIYAMIVFCIPWIIEVFMSLMDSVGFSVNYQECLSNAKSGDFSYFDSLLEEEEQIEEKTHEGNMKRSDGIAANVNMTIVADNLINLISRKDILGSTNSDLKYSKPYGDKKGNPWCAYFVHWALDNTSVTSDKDLWDYIVAGDTVRGCSGACAGDLIPIFDSHSNLKFNKSSYYGGSYTPKKGDIIFFWWREDNYSKDWDGKMSSVHKSSHVGIVNYVSENTIYTIEGNTNGGKVAERERELNSYYVMGYGSWY